MNAQQALEYSMQPFIPMFIYGDYDAMESERQRGEEAMKALLDEWRTNEEPGFDFGVILTLADQNRELCDQIGEARLRNLSSPLLARNLSDADLCAGIGKMQGRAASAVAREVRGDRDAYSVAYVRKPIKGTVLGIDIETTGTNAWRDYILDVGFERMNMSSPQPQDAQVNNIYAEADYAADGAYDQSRLSFGVPARAAVLGNPFILQLTGIDVSKRANEPLFDEWGVMQSALLARLVKQPYVAHNATFEHKYFMANVAGYAEAYRDGNITIIDTLPMSRFWDEESVASEQHPYGDNTLDAYAKRQGALNPSSHERHLGLEDSHIMLVAMRNHLHWLREHNEGPWGAAGRSGVGGKHVGRRTF